MSLTVANKLISIPFIDLISISSTTTTLEITTSREDIPIIVMIAQGPDDHSNLFQLIENIIDNKEQLNPESTMFSNLFQAFKPKLCLRKSKVTLKTMKVKGQKRNLGKLRKKTPENRSVDILLITETHLICLEENSPYPVYIFPVKQIIWKRTSPDIISFSCNSDKGSFQFSCKEECSLWFDACKKSKDVSEEEILSLEPIINELQAKYCQKFDMENPEHIQLLRRLWEAASLGNDKDGFCPFGTKSERWQTIGFQRDEPVSDLRASGLLGLQNLVYFAEKYTQLFLQMSRVQNSAETDMYYPFATAGINISFLMVKLLDLKRDNEWYPTMQLHPMFFYNRQAWEELYTIIFRLFDQKWKQMKLGYMGFQQVIDATEEGVYELIHKQSVMGVPAIFDMLGILLEDLETFRTDNSPRLRRRSATMVELSRIDAREESNDAEVVLRVLSQKRKHLRNGKRCRSAQIPT